MPELNKINISNATSFEEALINMRLSVLFQYCMQKGIVLSFPITAIEKWPIDHIAIFCDELERLLHIPPKR